ncbi:MAG: biopolymer transport protein TolR [Saprospiraceae bacterium]|jgi:biopolymer transport protein TolR
MNIRRRRKNRMMSEINVVPYIDVMLVLLIIFMVTAPLLSTGVDVELPSADASPLDDPELEPFVLTVTSNGDYYLNDNEEPEVSISDIQRKAASTLKQEKKTPFVVRGDAAVPYGKIVEGMVLLQAAGVKRVGMATKASEQ